MAQPNLEHNQDGSRKEPYEPPAVTRIQLAGDEIASTGCKATAAGANVCRKGSQLINLNIGT